MTKSETARSLPPYLPASDPRPRERQQQLDAYRDDYRFNYYYVPGYPFLDSVPALESFSPAYLAARVGSLAPLVLNELSSTIRTKFCEAVREPSDFDKLFAVYRKPAAVESWLSDAAFDEQRLTGCNPQAIHRIDEIPADFPLGDTDLQALLGAERTLDRACAERRLYMTDYKALAHIQGSHWNGRARTIPSPRALFVWVPSSQELRCAGIQLQRRPGGRVFKPSDPALDWLAAKIAYQCADACHQELGTHFAWTHMAMAPFAVVTRRQLALQHPVHILLAPHFQFFLQDNELGRTTFINPGGPVEDLMGGTLDESLGISLNVYKEWSILEAAPDKEVARRKLDDSAALPHYPFRDDGALVWRAIVDFVSQYVGLYYPCNQAIVDDKELQAWAAELASRDGGRVAGMPGRLESARMLIDILSVVIWTCGPLHSFLNFSQWDYINVPNMSYATYRDVPEQVGSVDPATLMAILPPYEQAALQLRWCKILTSYRHDQLGHYEQQLCDPRAQLVLATFQQTLTRVEQVIASRDMLRRVSFPYFKPSLCINSINT